MSFGSSKTNPTQPIIPGSSSSWEAGSSGSKSVSSSSSKDYGDNVWGPQQQHLKDLWGASSQMGGNDQYQQQAGGLFNQASQQLGQGLDGSYLQNAQNVIGNQTNPGMNPMMDVYARQVGQQFNEQIMPGLQGGAQLGGVRGGSRQGVAEGLAAARSGQQMQDFAAQLYSSDQDRALAAAGLGANIAGGAQSQVSQLGNFGMGIPWYNLNQQAGILGGPAFQDLGGKSSSSSSSSSFGSSSGGSESTGQSGGGGGGGRSFSFGL